MNRLGPDAMTDQHLLGAQRQIERLSILTNELLGIRTRFGPIYTYYFPVSWWSVMGRALRLREQPDFSRFSSELQALRDEAWRIIEEARLAFEAVAAAHVDLALKQAAQLGYHQVYYDGNVIILMNAWVKDMAGEGTESARYFFGMREFSQKSQANLVQLQDHARAVSMALPG